MVSGTLSPEYQAALWLASSIGHRRVGACGQLYWPVRESAEGENHNIGEQFLVGGPAARLAGCGQHFRGGRSETAGGLTVEPTLERAKLRLLEAARAARPNAVFDTAGYASQLEENLIEGVSRGQFEADYRAGAGRELGGKMRAAHSSAALVVNTFAPWRERLATLTIGGLGGFKTLRFEAVYRTGLGGTPPHLDVAAEGTRTLAIESKLVEYLTPKVAVFSPAYDTIVDFRCDSPWFRLIARLRANPPAYRYLDAGQLVKHSLGLMRGCPQATLLYLYWEPVNWREFREFHEHRDEIADLRASLGTASPALRTMTYSQLWEEWLSVEQQGWLPAHVERLRRRYEIAI